LLVLPPAKEATLETFREWLWGTRSMDLAVQVGIIFVGALGIAALLPRGDEIPRGDSTLLECDLTPEDEPKREAQ
jgi:hypothetical protein